MLSSWKCAAFQPKWEAQHLQDHWNKSNCSHSTLVPQLSFLLFWSLVLQVKPQNISETGPIKSHNRFRHLLPFVCVCISPAWSTMSKKKTCCFFDAVFLNNEVSENVFLKIESWDCDPLFSSIRLEQLPMTIYSVPQCAFALLKTITNPPSFFIHPLHSPVWPIPLSAVSFLPLALALLFLLFPPTQIIKWHYFRAFKGMYSLSKETFGLRNRSLQLSVKPSAEQRRTATRVLRTLHV